MKCTAKLRVTAITYHESPYEDGREGLRAVRMIPVQSTDPEDAENYAFGQATPSGDCTLFMAPEAAELFKPGEEVYVTFSSERPER